MISVRSLALSVACLALTATSAQAQDLSRYREFTLGMTLAAVAEQARLPVSAATTLHQRPHVIQELTWRPQQVTAVPEAARTARFRFYDGHLYHIIVEYDRNRTEGLTAEDFIEAISTAYGLATLQSTGIGVRPALELDDLALGTDRTITAQWSDSQYSVTLFRTTYPSGFALVLLAIVPDGLARSATAASTKLDVLEAPQREMDRQQKQAETDRAKAVKARAVNKPLFRF